MIEVISSEPGTSGTSTGGGGGRIDRSRDGNGGKSETSPLSADGGGRSSNNNGRNSPKNGKVHNIHSFFVPFLLFSIKIHKIYYYPFFIGSSNAIIGDGGKVVEVDDFVIIPAGTPFQEVVTTVLTLLGYPKDTIQQAVGK